MKRCLWVLTVAALVGALAAPLSAQTANLETLFSGKTIPLSLKLKDLNADWRVLGVEGAKDDFTAVMAAQMGAAGNEYYTNGETINIGGKTYMIAYRSAVKTANWMQLQQQAARGQQVATLVESEKLTPETPLALALLNLGALGSLKNIHPFNLQEEIAASEKRAQAHAEMLDNIVRAQAQRGVDGTGGGPTRRPPPRVAARFGGENEELFRAVGAGDAEKVQSLLKKDPASVNAIEDLANRWSVLHEAASEGRTEIVQLLLAHDADPNAINKASETPLHWAVRKGHTEIVKLLLDHKANPNAADEKQHTPLHEAAFRGQKESAELLLAAKADVNAKDKAGKTPLFYANDEGHKDIADLLQKQGAK